MADNNQGEGWIAFAIAMAMIAGSANVIFGITALFAKDAVSGDSLAYLTVQQLGWVLVIFGVLQFAAAFMISAKKNSGRMLAIVIAALSLLGWMFWVGTLPLAGITALVLNVLIIYGLSVTKKYFA